MRSFAEIARGKSREEQKAYWNDVFSAFGASLYVEKLPEWEGYRPLPGDTAQERPKRITWVNRQRVPGSLQVEVMKHWHQFVGLFEESAAGEEEERGL